MTRTLDLNGKWLARWNDGQRERADYARRDTTVASRYIEAQVPGEIHLDLQRAGLIGDVHVGMNALSARWVEECFWNYRREFTAPAAALKAKHAWLDFQQLDLVATIFLNGVEVGRSDNVFHPCRVDVAGKLRPGRNVLAVTLDGGLFSVAEKTAEGMGLGDDAKLHKRVWLRKPQCQFNWDWSIRLVNVGITGPVRLEWTDDDVRIDQFEPLASLSGDLSSGRVRARLFVEGLAAGDVPATLSVSIPAKGISVTKEVTVKPGLAAVEADLDVPSPELWWPVGHGAQPLYEVRAVLKAGGREIGRAARKVGFRRVRIDQSLRAIGGTHFIVEVNGRRVFCKGGNFVPPDMILMLAGRERMEKLVDLALESNFNILRVWGGGRYESDDFYDICDEKGILVWQEFIFACGKFPDYDREFHASFVAEARWNIRRLAPHASLAVWCGNNEMEWGTWDWGYENQGMVSTDYRLFHLTIPRLLAEDDPDRYYQPSSPFSPGVEPPNSDTSGDQHPWFIGFYDVDFRKYRAKDCTFPNEGGMLGPCALPTIDACLPEGQKFPHSFTWEFHDNSTATSEEPCPSDQMTSFWLGKDIDGMSLSEYAYWAGLVHGEALAEYCDNFHRRMFDTASAIFWMYNDNWPMVRSWTTVDYYCRRTPAFHPVRRAMEPVRLVLVEQGGGIRVHGINETCAAIEADLDFGVMELSGGYPLRMSAKVTLPPGASTVVAAFPASKWKRRKASIAFAQLLDNGRLLTRNRLFTERFKDMEWPAARLSVRVEKGFAVFESPVFTWGVCLDLDGERKLADNFFDVFPGVPYRIPWAGGEPPKVVATGNLAGEGGKRPRRRA